MHPDFKDNPRVVKSANAVRERIRALGYVPYFQDIINTLYVRDDILAAASNEIDYSARPSPRVTVAIPVHNGAATLARTLASVASQTYKDFHVVIADNASTDTTAAVIDKFLETQSNVTTVKRNSLVDVQENFMDLMRRAQTEYFVWLADDDWWEPDFLAECVKALDRNNAAAVAFTYFRVFYHHLSKFSGLIAHIPSQSNDPALNLLIRTTDMAPSAFYGVYRLPILREVVAACPDPIDFADVLFTLQTAIRGQMEIVPRDLYRAGVRDESVIQRRSLSGGKPQYLPFLKRVTSLIIKKFGLVRGATVEGYFIWRLLALYRHNGRVAEQGSAILDTMSLVDFDQVRREAREKEPAPAKTSGLQEYLSEAVALNNLPVAEVQDFNARTRDKWVAEQAATVPTGARVLDVGAGTAPYRHLFSHCVYETHDFAQYQNYQDGSEGKYAPLNYVSDVCKIPVPDKSFDVILCTEVLEHVPYPIDALAEMCRIVKPGGTLFITAPLGSGLHQQPFHFYGGYTDHWYRKFLTEFGCEAISIEPNHGFFAHLAQECARFSWTYHQHKQFHGNYGPELSDLMEMCWRDTSTNSTRRFSSVNSP